MADTNYEALVKQAELAVVAVKDPDLKRIAFEKILDSLLAAPEARRAIKTNTLSPSGSASGKSGNSKRIPNKRTGTAAYLEELVDEGFFAKPKTIATVKSELGNRGHHIPLTSLSGPLQGLCQQRRLRREKSQPTDGGKKAFAYSNW